MEFYRLKHDKKIVIFVKYINEKVYTLSEARSRVDWEDLMAAQGAFGTDFYDKSTRMIVGTML